MHTSSPAMAAALLSFITALPAHAGAAPDPGLVPQVVVRYGDLNVETEAGALTLYERIVGAARRVCPSARVRDLGRIQAVHTCREESVARAIAAANIPRLAAIQTARTTRTRAS